MAAAYVRTGKFKNKGSQVMYIPWYLSTLIVLEVSSRSNQYFTEILSYFSRQIFWKGAMDENLFWQVLHDSICKNPKHSALRETTTAAQYLDMCIFYDFNVQTTFITLAVSPDVLIAEEKD